MQVPMGSFVPMVNNRAEAQDFVSACHYAPAGRRSYGPLRARLYGGVDYQERANETIVAFAMIETREALANIDEIVSTPGLDAIYIGPSDFALALGHEPQFDHPAGPVYDAIMTVLAAAKKQGLVAGIHNGTPKYANGMIQAGFDFVSLSSDLRHLSEKVGEILAVMNRSRQDEA